MNVRILVADVMDALRSLPDDSVHCVVTSVPYWGLRDYDTPGQIGLERTLGEHIGVMVDVFREIRRVLRKDGTLWLNYGDSYAATRNGRSAADTIGPVYAPNHSAGRGAFRSGDRQSRVDHGGRIVAGGFLKPKDLVMAGNRLAIALQDDGWWVRSEIIWHKPNPMPETVRDRPAQCFEKVWLLTRSARYFYDVQAVKQPVTGGAKPRRSDGQTKPKKGSHAHDRRAGSLRCDQMPTTRHLRNVWEMPIEGFPGAHFATFPRKLPELCIKAGCPVGGVVLDPFAGAGTTGLVADQLGRDSILIELSADYAEIARRRIEAHRFHAVVTVEALAAHTAEAAE
jgi:DNA modification methylase